MSEISPGRNYPVLCCMFCGGALRKTLGGYRCAECGELFTLEEAGLQGVEIISIKDKKDKKTEEA